MPTFYLCIIKRKWGEHACLLTHKNIIKELLIIFRHNDEERTLALQIADEEYFHKLSIVGGKLKKQIPQTYKAIQFLANIPKDIKFILVLGDVTEYVTTNNLYQIQKELNRLNNIEFPIVDGIIADSYNIYTFGEKRICIGEFDKKKRVCRFCRQSYPIVTFKKTAHAISESLGNKLLFCYEECDKCNENFGKSIECDIFKIHPFFIPLFSRARNAVSNK